jgi:hypothetical protein
MSATIKTVGAVQTTISTVAGHTQKKMIAETAGVLLIGTLISTGGAFQRAFPSMAAASQWLSAGGGADVDVSRVEPCTFVS